MFWITKVDLKQAGMMSLILYKLRQLWKFQFLSSRKHKLYRNELSARCFVKINLTQSAWTIVLILSKMSPFNFLRTSHLAPTLLYSPYPDFICNCSRKEIYKTWWLNCNHTVYVIVLVWSSGVVWKDGAFAFVVYMLLMEIDTMCYLVNNVLATKLLRTRRVDPHVNGS